MVTLGRYVAGYMLIVTALRLAASYTVVRVMCRNNFLTRMAPCKNFFTGQIFPFICLVKSSSERMQKGSHSVLSKFLETSSPLSSSSRYTI